MDGYGLAWTIYSVGALGCGVAAWFMFRRFGREWAQFFFVSVLALLLTPYAVDAEQMLMAPAIFLIVFEGFNGGIDAVMPIVMVVSGVWLAGLVLSLLLQLVVRRVTREAPAQQYPRKAATTRQPKEDHHHHDDDFSDDAVPLRAER